jgi:hypothetical protein
MKWDESTNVCGKMERKASTVKPVAIAKPKSATKAERAKSKSAKGKSVKKQTSTKRSTVSRKQVQSTPARPGERRPFRLFRNRPVTTQ